MIPHYHHHGNLVRLMPPSNYGAPLVASNLVHVVVLSAHHIKGDARYKLDISNQMQIYGDIEAPRKHSVINLGKSQKCERNI